MACGSMTLEEMFSKFATFGKSKSDGKSITLSQSNKWMKQAGVISNEITTTDTEICFNKLESKSLNFEDFEKFLQDLATYKNVEYNEIVAKLVVCGLPCCNAMKTVTGTVDKETDTSKSTEQHKAKRCDAEGNTKEKEE